MDCTTEAYSSFDLFQEALYHPAIISIPEFLRVYSHLLRDKKSTESIMHANRLDQYLLEITNRSYFTELRKSFNQLYNLIDNEFPDLKFNITGRIKSVTSMDKKIVKFLNNGKSLDRIRDTAAFRILIFGHFPEDELVKKCYTVMNSIIEHNNSLGYILCEPGKAQETMTEDNLKNSHLIIPENSLISPAFVKNVKDYIRNPKENGYQSIHAVFRKPSGGQCFEIQVRTLKMHTYAESGEANHSDYKQKKYVDVDYFIQPEKVYIDGYGLDPNGNKYDFIGLEDGLQILQRQKVF